MHYGSAEIPQWEISFGPLPIITLYLKLLGHSLIWCSKCQNSRFYVSYSFSSFGSNVSYALLYTWKIIGMRLDIVFCLKLATLTEVFPLFGPCRWWHSRKQLDLACRFGSWMNRQQQGEKENRKEICKVLCEYCRLKCLLPLVNVENCSDNNLWKIRFLTKMPLETFFMIWMEICLQFRQNMPWAFGTFGVCISVLMLWFMFSCFFFFNFIFIIFFGFYLLAND